MPACFMHILARLSLIFQVLILPTRCLRLSSLLLHSTSSSFLFLNICNINSPYLITELLIFWFDLKTRQECHIFLYSSINKSACTHSPTRSQIYLFSQLFLCLSLCHFVLSGAAFFPAFLPHAYHTYLQQCQFYGVVTLLVCTFHSHLFHFVKVHCVWLFSCVYLRSFLPLSRCVSVP